MKITVVGRGNAGCLTALHYAYHTRHRKDISVELLYDPNIPPEKVGQGTLLEPPKLLWSALGINWYDNPINATPKFGILYEDWGKKNKKSFASPFPLYSVALHYNPVKLQETILKSKYFKVKEKHIDNYDQIDSDYIFDCRGRPSKNWKDYTQLINPINAVLLVQDSKRDPNVNWTRAVATPDGWCFVIPNQTNTTSYGYLYNHRITSKDKAEKNFKRLFNLKSTDQFKFKQYVAKKPVIDNRIILGGNRLFFLEPLEATAIHAYLKWARMTWDWIIDKKVTPEFITNEFHTYVNQIQNFILWHYSYGSKYNTPFWKAAKKLKIKDPLFNKTLKEAKLSPMIELLDDQMIGTTEIYGQWHKWNFKCWYNGMKNTKEPPHFPLL
jgi:hypothetical protein